MRPWPLLLLLALAALVAADTEIVNFRLPLTGKVVAPPRGAALASLTASQRQAGLTVSDAQPEVWVALDLEDKGKSWTARLSWPGSSPTRFAAHIHPSGAGGVLLHITAAPLSPRMPHPLLRRVRALFGENESKSDDDAASTHSHSSWTSWEDIGLVNYNSADPTSPADWPFHTDFHLVLEPLILGVLPATAASALAAIALFALAGALIAPYLIRALRRLILGLEEDKAADAPAAALFANMAAKAKSE
ncbi:hypothetical protein Q8F55_000314 [Vanrija albida]|uniref:Uncharacterized protein n=1 Tax=Vanrija albida TaxID=181172 RepID=A0ABR3QDI8_9TREE